MRFEHACKTGLKTTRAEFTRAADAALADLADQFPECDRASDGRSLLCELEYQEDDPKRFVSRHANGAPHAARVADLGDGMGAWLRWSVGAPRSRRVVEMADCPRCSLFDGHPGACSPWRPVAVLPVTADGVLRLVA